ncbi:MAG: metal-dependent transcriptional regulator [Spirochaetes bacterium]|nr:metal-dependent transcriptional regulator [Spirochaetota bacterium]
MIKIDADCNFESTDLSSNMEDYVESIELLSRKKKVVRVKDIAKSLNIKMPSVTAALQKLEEKGLINYERYGYVDLTESGKAIAEKVYNRHSFLTDFFHDVLKIDRKRADKVACRVEHDLTSEACKQIFKLIQFYKSESSENREWTERLNDLLEQRSLSEIREGDTSVIIFINESPYKKRLSEMGFRKGENIRVIKYAPLKDPIEVKIKDYNISLRVEEAKSIIVKPVINGTDEES